MEVLDWLIVISRTSGNNAAASAANIDGPNKLASTGMVMRLKMMFAMKIRIGGATVWATFELQIFGECKHKSVL